MKTNWIDFKALRAKLDFEAVLKHYGVEVKRKGNQHQGFCPLPNHNGKKNSPSFSAQLEKGIFQCFFFSPAFKITRLPLSLVSTLAAAGAFFATGSSSVTDLLQRLPNADDLHSISAQQESLHVVASAVIVYASAQRKEQPET